MKEGCVRLSAVLCAPSRVAECATHAEAPEGTSRSCARWAGRAYVADGGDGRGDASGFGVEGRTETGLRDGLDGQELVREWAILRVILGW